MDSAIKRSLLREYYKTRGSIPLDGMKPRRIEAWATKRRDNAARAAIDRRIQLLRKDKRFRSRARSLEHASMQEQMQAQRNVEKEATMELDENPKAELPAPSFMEDAAEKLSHLHLG